jgi:hypothetical protein
MDNIDLTPELNDFGIPIHQTILHALIDVSK